MLKFICFLRDKEPEKDYHQIVRYFHSLFISVKKIHRTKYDQVEEDSNKSNKSKWNFWKATTSHSFYTTKIGEFWIILKIFINLQKKKRKN